MTDLARIAHADLTACFDLFERSAFRLETLPAYAVGGAEAERLRAFQLGLPRPERSVRTSPWLARIDQTTAAGKSWRRVRVVGWPLTEYERYQMLGYQESATAGDVIRIADRVAHPELRSLTRISGSSTPKHPTRSRRSCPMARMAGISDRRSLQYPRTSNA